MSDHSDHGRGRSEVGDWVFSRTGIATVVAITILGFLVYTGHSAHLLGALPWLLILACPLMHIFMHGGHGSHHHHGGDMERPANGRDQADKQPEKASAHDHH